MHTEGASCLKSLDHKVAGLTDFIFPEKNAHESMATFQKLVSSRVCCLEHHGGDSLPFLR